MLQYLSNGLKIKNLERIKILYRGLVLHRDKGRWYSCRMDNKVSMEIKVAITIVLRLCLIDGNFLKKVVNKQVDGKR